MSKNAAEQSKVNEIRNAAKTAKPDIEAAGRAARYVKATMASKRFESHNVTPDGLPIHRFHVIGDSVTGVLGECNGQTGWGESTYPIVQDDDTIICVPGNRRLVQALKKGKFTFQRIRIEYKGRLHNSMGHYEKVFAVTLAPRG